MRAGTPVCYDDHPRKYEPSINVLCDKLKESKYDKVLQRRSVLNTSDFAKITPFYSQILGNLRIEFCLVIGYKVNKPVKERI